MSSPSRKSSRNRHHLKLATSAGDDPIYTAVELAKRAEVALDACGENEPVGDLTTRFFEARSALARTVPKTPAGLRALTSYLREASGKPACAPYFNSEGDARAFAASLDTAVAGITGVAPKHDVGRRAFSEMEAPLLDARGLTKALVMAIAGEHRVAMEPDQMNDALERLALAIDEKLDEAVKIWEGPQ
jgi:hypothetical protein